MRRSELDDDTSCHAPRVVGALAGCGRRGPEKGRCVIVLSAYEQRHWRQLEQQLAGDRRLVALAAKFERAAPGRPRPLRWLLVALISVSIALAVAATGAVTGYPVMIGIGVGLMFVIPMLIGALALLRLLRRRLRW